MMRYILLSLIGAILFAEGDFPAPKPPGTQVVWDSLIVEASAYITSDKVAIAAWGDTLKPGMQALAISRDLLDSGLYYNARVKVNGFEGEFLVMDKMNRQWRNTIDIYMGADRQRAIDWGRRREVMIYFVKQK